MKLNREQIESCKEINDYLINLIKMCKDNQGPNETVEYIQLITDETTVKEGHKGLFIRYIFSTKNGPHFSYHILVDTYNRRFTYYYLMNYIEPLLRDIKIEQVLA